MLSSLKNYIKSKPRLYDKFNAYRPLQSETEKWLNYFSIANKKSVQFIQIGANDGLRWDPVRRFITRDGWSGILVEPLPQAFTLLKKNYAHIKHNNLVFVNAAISSNNENLHLWSFSESFLNKLSIEDRFFYLRKSSLNKKIVISHLKGLDNIDEKIKCFNIKCISINSLVEKFWKHNEIDLIVIDAEGHDANIIRSINFQIICPKAILYESHNLGDDKQRINGFLKDKGYNVYDLGGDSVAEYAVAPK